MDELEKFMAVRGFTDDEKKAARKILDETGEYTNGSSQFMGPPKAPPKPTPKTPKVGGGE